MKKLKWKDAGHYQIVTANTRGDRGFTINVGVKSCSLYNHVFDDCIGHFKKLSTAKKVAQLIYNR